MNVNVRKGEMVSLIGPSGSGKTTLLNIVGGLDKPTAGTIRVFDADISNMTPADLVNFRRTTVGHIFQNMNLIPTLTAAENVEMPMAALRIPYKNREMKVRELISVVGMEDRVNHKPGELSGGEQQRVALAAALANDPPLILADEPTGELDTENARIVVEYLRKINQKLGKTVIMVTHDPNISRISDRILRINDGIVQADVTPTMTQEKPDYGEMIKNRIAEIEANLEALEGQFKAGTITGSEYAEKQTKYKQTIDILNDELHRLGVV